MEDCRPRARPPFVEALRAIALSGHVHEPTRGRTDMGSPWSDRIYDCLARSGPSGVLVSYRTADAAAVERLHRDNKALGKQAEAAMHHGRINVNVLRRTVMLTQYHMIRSWRCYALPPRLDCLPNLPQHPYLQRRVSGTMISLQHLPLLNRRSRSST